MRGIASPVSIQSPDSQVSKKRPTGQDPGWTTGCQASVSRAAHHTDMDIFPVCFLSIAKGGCVSLVCVCVGREG